jgi:hypothetical protein
MRPLTYEARTSAGVLIATFQHEDQAARWVESEGPTYPGFSIEAVRVIERRTVLWRDEAHRVAA